MLNLGIIGCGRVTSMFHVKAISKEPRVQIKAVSDIDPKRMKLIQQKYTVPSGYKEYTELLDDESIDAVAVNTPPQFHEKMVLDSLNNGKHVLCEKPLSISVEGCRRIMQRRDESGLVVLPGRNYAFTPSLLLMQDLIADGRIGRITGMRVAFENNLKQYKPVTDFRTHKYNGLVEDVLPHVLTVIHPILGYCTSVDDVNWSCKNYDVCDNMSALLKTSSGVNVKCIMSWTKMMPTFEVKVLGEKGKLSGEFGLKPFTVEVETEAGTNTIDEKGLSWYLDLIQFKHPSFENQYKHFADLVLNGGKPRVAVQDEINILKTIKTLSTYLGQ